MSKCILCEENKAVLPDRDRMGRPIARICKQCHAARLTGDLEYITKCRERKLRLYKRMENE